MLLVGSRALNYWIPDRKVNDWDVITTRDELKAWHQANSSNILSEVSAWNGNKAHFRLSDQSRIEFEIATPDSSTQQLLDLSSDYPEISFGGMKLKVPPSEILFLVKKSHITKPINWWKHINDYHLLKGIGADKKLDDHLNEILKLRIAETDKRYPSPKPSLNMPNEKFFGKSQKVVGRTFNHDDLHLVTCFYDEPLHAKMKFDRSKALVEKSLWDAFSYDDKIKAVQEEAFAIALERKVIPAINNQKSIDQTLAFRHAVERICTTLTAGWFREFAIENVPKIMVCNVDYVDKFKTWLDKQGKVVPSVVDDEDVWEETDDSWLIGDGGSW